MKRNVSLFLSTLLLSLIFAATTAQGVFSQTPTQLDPDTIPKWINELAQAPSIYAANNITDSSGKLIRQEYVVNIREFQQQLAAITQNFTI